MELTKEQIQEIDNYISACGIKYYDVKMEIVDHFATKLEERLEENPTLDFKKALIEEHKKFSNNGFKKLLSTKETATQNRFIKMSLAHLKTFFRLPKIILSVALFVVLYQTMQLFADKKDFFLGLTVVMMALFLVMLVRIFNEMRLKKTKFLILNQTHLFFQMVNMLLMFSNNGVSFRTEKSYLDNGYNTIHLAFFVLMFLAYWSMEYVYQQNRKEVQKQYPNVVV